MKGKRAEARTARQVLSCEQEGAAVRVKKKAQGSCTASKKHFLERGLEQSK
jgi:hypothetical protein